MQMMGSWNCRLLPSPYFGRPLQSVHALSSSLSSLLPTQGTHGDSAVRARPSAPSTHFSLPSPPSSLLWTPTAKCPRTIFFSLLPPPYLGRPLQSVHALSSSLSSLLSTLDAHCKVSTHYLLLSPPSSLPWTPTAKCPRTIFFSLLPPLYFGCPLQSVHALLPPLSSLLSTLQARPSAPSTHFSLLSPPYSLLTIKLCEFRA